MQQPIIQSGGFLNNNPYMQGAMDMHTPAINFTPTFKFINGGNDFSTEKTDQHQNNDNDNNFQQSSIPFQNQEENIIQKSGGTNLDNKKTENTQSGGLIDFGKLVIKKMGL